MKQRKSDSLWKVVLEDVFPDMLRFIFSDADEVYDLARGFEFLDKELAELYPQPDEGKDSRFADKLVKVFLRNGEEAWVLLHAEVVRLVSRLFNCSFPRGDSRTCLSVDSSLPWHAWLVTAGYEAQGTTNRKPQGCLPAQECGEEPLSFTNGQGQA